MLKKYTAIGIMSGSSCDGLDIALCEFVKKNNGWDYKIVHGNTIVYNKEWKHLLLHASSLNGCDLIKVHNDFGIFVGEQVKKFLNHAKTSVDLIASHGHTVFHQPSEKITFQIGNGAHIAAINSITTVCDFRTLDVALSGQGSPLVPLGDMLLFPEYHYCMNLGGFANISTQWHNKRIAYDICPVNIALNYYANLHGLDMDQDGALAEKGNINNKLLIELNNLPYYTLKYPKSLSREWMEKHFIPVIEKHPLTIEDKLRTICEHISVQLANTVKSSVTKKILLTGGGVYNKFLIHLFKQKTKQLIILPSDNLINYKEALIFGFLGILRLRGEVNCLSTVTGASFDNKGGVIYRI